MFGFHNRILIVDLEKKTSADEWVEDDIYRDYLGGKGLGSYLLLDRSITGTDAFAAENPLIFATGPATDTGVWGSSRYGIFAKSPQTGLYGESYSGGRVAESMSRTGYDAVIIEGISESPVYIDIRNDKVEFRDASHLWGKETYATEDIMRDEVGDKSAGTVVIGPAGENLVRFAVIENNYWRSGGRTGIGAVMGSKKVKGIAFHGEQQKKVADPELLFVLGKEIREKSRNDSGVSKYREAGTLQLVPVINRIGAFPTRYWQAGTFDRWENLTIDALRAECDVKVSACARCFIACGKKSTVREGRHAGLTMEGPEYETVFSFGGLCLIDDIREIVYLNDICDRLGIDTITAGNLAGFTIEASQRGAIPECYSYGDVDSIASLLHQIAYKRGIGATLAEGIKYASREWGLDDLAIHVKGLEPAGYDPRTLNGMGLSYATSDRGACHLRATFYKPELSGMLDTEQVEDTALQFIEWEDRTTIHDALILCKFFRDLYQWEGLEKIVRGTTGMDTSVDGLRKIAENIMNVVRAFNVREGMSELDEKLPKRFFKEELKDSGRLLDETAFNQMLSHYYRFRGWKAAC